MKKFVKSSKMSENISLFSLEGEKLDLILSSIRSEIIHESITSKLETVSEPVFNKYVEYCQTCYIQCDNKSHYQSEFHTFNLQLKTHHSPILSLEEFEKLTEEQKSSMLEESDCSSSDDEEDLVIRNDPKILLSINPYRIKFFKALLIHTDVPEQKVEDINNIFTIHKSCHFGIFMFRSGYFSAGIIENVFKLI